MIYVFEDGRIIYDHELLETSDTGKYVAVETLPNIPYIDGKVGYIVADLSINKLEFSYFDYVEPEPKPEYPEPKILTGATLEEIKEMQLTIMSAIAELYEMAVF